LGESKQESRGRGRGRRTRRLPAGLEARHEAQSQNAGIMA